MDTSDAANPKLVWVPAKDLDQAVYAWMQTDRARLDDAAEEEEEGTDVVLLDGLPAGAGREHFGRQRPESGPRPKRPRADVLAPAEIDEASCPPRVGLTSGTQQDPLLAYVQDWISLCGPENFDQEQRILVKDFQGAARQWIRQHHPGEPDRRASAMGRVLSSKCGFISSWCDGSHKQREYVVMPSLVRRAMRDNGFWMGGESVLRSTVAPQAGVSLLDVPVRTISPCP